MILLTTSLISLLSSFVLGCSLNIPNNNVEKKENVVVYDQDSKFNTYYRDKWKNKKPFEGNILLFSQELNTIFC